MNEALWRRSLRTALTARGFHTTHHEDMLQAGVLDLSYSHAGVNGWIELKYLAAWPRRSATPVKLRTFTNEQRGFLINGERRGGHHWLLIRVGTDYLLISGGDVREVGLLCKGDLLAVCTMFWAGRLDHDKLIDTLTGG